MGLRKPDKTITSGGIVLPELTNPATAADIASSKEAVDQNGVLLTGTLPEVLSGKTETLTLAAPSHASGNIRMTGTMQEDKILRSGSKVMNMIASSYFGDAVAEDVAEGKTFTSSAGLNVVGTSKLADKTVGDATAADIAEGKIAWVNGVEIVGTMSHTLKRDTDASFTKGTVSFYNDPSAGNVEWKSFVEYGEGIENGQAYALVYNGHVVGLGVGGLNSSIYMVNCGNYRVLDVDLEYVSLYKIT